MPSLMHRRRVLQQLVTYIGLDVHKETIAVAVVEAGKRSEVREYGKIANTPAAVKALAAKLARNGRELRFCYEAGPCGYAIQRQLTASKHDCIVVAPSLIPRRPGERIKTDRRDAINLAKLHRAGELTSVWVPDQAHEAIRDLVRARQAAVRTLRQARQRLSGFLLRQGHHYKRPAWTLMHRRWLAGLRFEHAVHHIVLEDCIAAVEAAMARRDRLDAHIEAALPDWSLATMVHALRRCAAWRWWLRQHWLPNSVTSHASPIHASSWRISVWCHPSTPAAARDAKAALQRLATVRRGECSSRPLGAIDSRHGSAASSCCGRKVWPNLSAIPRGRRRNGCAGGIASSHEWANHRPSLPPRSPASWQASSGQSPNRRRLAMPDTRMLAEQSQGGPIVQTHIQSWTRLEA